MIWVGEKGRNIYSTWSDFSADDKKELSKYYGRFENYVKPCSNEVYNRYKFQTRSQNDPESFDQFVTELKLLVKDCRYHPEEVNKVVRDRIVIGVRSNKIREKLINVGSDLTLEKAIELSQVYEMSSSQAKSIAGNIEDSSVHAVKVKHKKHDKGQGSRNKLYDKGKSPSNRHGTASGKKLPKCSRCGTKHDAKTTCPASGQTCHKCGKLNHFKTMCRSKSDVHTVDHSDSSDSDESDVLYLGSINTVRKSDDDGEWSETLEIAGTKVNFQLDTGAKCNVLPLSVYRKLNIGKGKIPPSKTRLKSYTNHKVKAVGKVTLDCTYKGEAHKTLFEIVDLNAEPVLGAKSCSAMGLVKRIHRVDTPISRKVSNSNVPADIFAEFSDNFEGLGLVPIKHKIRIDDSVEPVVHPPRRTPIALRDKIKAELERMTDLGVIEKQEEPTPWVNSMVTVLKPNGKLRICIDPKDLNKAILREHYPLKTIEDVLERIPEAKVFTKLDATSGFWQIGLDEESSKLCTFNSPFGRYRFTRLPFGIKSASEVYQRFMSDMVHDLPGCEAIIDDLIIWGKDMEEHDARLKAVMQRVRENNLKLSVDKCEFRKDRVSYVGHVLTAEGVKPDYEKIRAVQEMPRPQNVSELHTFMGFIQYLGKFIPNLSEVTAPLRLLLEKNIVWHWDGEQEDSFCRLRKLVTDAPVLRYYDQSKELTLTVDASSKGLGAALVQEGQPIAYASRALSKSQQNYAQIEKESLAIAFGCTKFHQYVFGRRVRVESDHKPLQSIFRKPLYQAPSRLQSILLTLQRYDLDVQYKPGKTMFLADTLSRAYLNETKEKLVPDLAVNLLSYLPISPEQYEKFQNATLEDADLQTLQGIVKSGWPDVKAKVPLSIRAYWPYRDEISCIDGLLYKAHKIIVPQGMRSEMLQRIHSSHLGIVKCKSRARESLFWPGMSTQIEELISKCATCVTESKKNPKEPLMETETADRPHAIVSADLMDFQGHTYLVTVDHFSSWPEIAKLDNLSSEHTILRLKSQFSRYGIPDKFYSDNGPQFASDSFRKFAKDYGFVHITSSPHYAQSNGRAERTVQTIKNILKKASDPYKAMLAYRNTPLHKIGLSPSQLFLGRRLKTDLPTSAELLKSKSLSTQEVEERLKTKKFQDKINYDKHAGSTLRDLYPGEQTVIRHNDRWTPATVVDKHQTPRSYVMQTQTGRKLRRNRRDIRPTAAKFPQDATPDDTPADPQQQASGNQSADPPPDPPDNQPIIPAPPVMKTRSGRIVRPPKRFQKEEEEV